MNQGGKPQASHIKMPRFCLGYKQTPMHILLPAQANMLQTPVLPVPMARLGPLLASQIPMEPKPLPDDARVFPKLDLYLGNSCDTHELSCCWENTSPSSKVIQFFASHSWCPLSQPRQRQKVGVQGQQATSLLAQHTGKVAGAG